MKIIGITGGIGTGKSTVLNFLKQEYNAYIVEADRLAHELMLPGEAAYRQITDIFGTAILSTDGTIDRNRLGTIVFGDAEALRKLNAVIHPAVKQHILQDIEARKKEGNVKYYVIEAALLIEDGYKTICDELWYIYTEKEERIRRLIAGRGGSREKWEHVIGNQSSDDYYRTNCDYVIDNGRGFEYTINIVKELLS
jgi:dephospho-CoA kinase